MVRSAKRDCQAVISTWISLRPEDRVAKSDSQIFAADRARGVAVASVPSAFEARSRFSRQIGRGRAQHEQSYCEHDRTRDAAKDANTRPLGRSEERNTGSRPFFDRRRSVAGLFAVVERRLRGLMAQEPHPRGCPLKERTRDVRALWDRSRRCSVYLSAWRSHWTHSRRASAEGCLRPSTGFTSSGHRRPARRKPDRRREGDRRETACLTLLRANHYRPASR
jgi:hypothetical protein